MPMAPYGKQGCCWRVPYNLAAIALAIHPKRLKEIPDEEIPKGVIPLEPKYIPTIEEMTPVAMSVGEGRNIAAEMGPKLTFSGGRAVVRESGFASPADSAVSAVADREAARLLAAE